VGDGEEKGSGVIVMRSAECGVRNRGMERAVAFSPLGWFGVLVSEKGVCRIVLPKMSKRAAERALPACSESGVRSSGKTREKASQICASTIKLLQRYFSGGRVSFDLLLDLGYYTSFQQAVWKAAAEVPYGETRSYGWIAKRIKRPKAVRAVGQALGANPVPIVVPCHRVISASGKIGGFSGGLGMKKKLLELEAGRVGRREVEKVGR
jgi:methylated-DNA-[protein]-cysteine S-methyltransferase